MSSSAVTSAAFLGYSTILSPIRAALVLTAWAARPDGGGLLRQGLRRFSTLQCTAPGRQVGHRHFAARVDQPLGDAAHRPVQRQADGG